MADTLGASCTVLKVGRLLAVSPKDVRIDCTRKVQCLMLDRMNASTQTIRINVRTEQEQVDLGAALGQGPGTSTDRSLLGLLTWQAEMRFAECVSLQRELAVELSL